MSAIMEGNKRTSWYDLASGDIAGTYLWNEVTDKIAGSPDLITKNGSNVETRNLLGCWATYANDNYISNIDDEGIVVSGNCIRVTVRIPLTNMYHQIHCKNHLSTSQCIAIAIIYHRPFLDNLEN